MNKPTKWTPDLEREFRLLSLKEAKQQIDYQSLVWLNQLSDWRNDLLCPQTPEELKATLEAEAKIEELTKQLDELLAKMKKGEAIKDERQPGNPIN